ncbi:YciI family protein [Actinophytocola sp. NPDC049390]|uniref:YciI family protein n=1 Tax=Actinophytocola sp. NPDC049390 TaxID=3363894 RepID=UPI0037B860E2
MRFMVMVKTDGASEQDASPSADDIAEMGRYNDELIKAGVLLAGEGLLPSAKGARVRFTNGTPTVIDGPFTEAKELVAGFWLLDVKSKEEAIEWVKRVPCTEGVESHIEIRQVLEPEDLIPSATAEA